ncbi:hypothetical protein CRG98_041607 [Punica granatum]|uniref:Uncharacterized protein n=1 Tax=Punica granatum TaxID=22663 RepID=A0A2I0I223_PUNGR|nr:hypothetical protein CRG98_041607 [Punica granatum]
MWRDMNELHKAITFGRARDHAEHDGGDDEDDHKSDEDDDEANKNEMLPSSQQCRLSACCSSSRHLQPLSFPASSAPFNSAIKFGELYATAHELSVPSSFQRRHFSSLLCSASSTTTLLWPRLVEVRPKPLSPSMAVMVAGSHLLHLDPKPHRHLELSHLPHLRVPQAQLCHEHPSSSPLAKLTTCLFLYDDQLFTMLSDPTRAILKRKLIDTEVVGILHGYRTGNLHGEFGDANWWSQPPNQQGTPSRSSQSIRELGSPIGNPDPSIKVTSVLRRYR